MLADPEPVEMNEFVTERSLWSHGEGSDAPLSRVELELELELWSLFVDKVAASISDEFARRGIESILLKGPAIASWLYGDGESRPYGDADLLVAPTDWEKAEGLLAELGFQKELGPLNHPGMATFSSEAWMRGGENVDLHCTLWGMGAEPERVWEQLSQMTEPMPLDGRTLQVLTPPARTLVLTTHAAKHGDGQAFLDLDRAVATLPLGLWRQAAALAIDLEAVPAFVAGIRLVPEGREIVRELGLPDVPMPEASLRLWRVPMALGLEQLANTPGLRAKLQVIVHEVFPRPAFMRWWTPLARRGRIGLVLSYLWRLLWVVRYAIPAVRAWRSARRGRSQAPRARRRRRRRRAYEHP